MLRICIPVHNEATTIGVLLWRLRTVFQGFSREYDVVVYDDASTDNTAEVLEPYQAVMPLTVLRGARHLGYAASIDALVRHVAADDEYARRDAMVLLQGDFTESPEHLPELVKRFEGGADLVAVERTIITETPLHERRMRRWGSWAVKPFLRLPPVTDPFTGYRLVRISVLRDLLRAMGGTAVCAGDGWAANIDFALNLAPFARRIENVPLAPRYDVRQRPSRRRGWPDIVALFHWARAARRIRRPSPGTKPSGDPGSAPRERAAEVAVSTTPPKLTGSNGVASRQDRNTRTDRASREGGRPPRGENRPPRAPKERPAESQTEAVAEARPRAERPPRPERPPRGERPERPERPERAERVRAPRPPVEASEAEGPDELMLSMSPVDPEAVLSEATTTVDITDVAGATEAPAKRKRRRRRSRRERAGRDSGESEGGDDVLDAGGDDTDAGTTDGAGGEERDGGDEGGDDDAGQADGEAGGAASGEPGRKRRRSRRRRRARRPGDGDTAGPDSPPSSAAEPPSA